MFPVMASPTTTSPFTLRTPPPPKPRSPPSAKARSIRRSSSQFIPRFSFSESCQRSVSSTHCDSELPMAHTWSGKGTGIPTPASWGRSSRRTRTPPSTPRVPAPTSSPTTPVPSTPGATPKSTPQKETDEFEKKNFFVYKHGMKLHPYSTREAAYMQAYDSVVLENERHTLELYHRLTPQGSPSFARFDNGLPSSVLDLGCGQGCWVQEAAVAWGSSGTKVTGLDLVDVCSDTWEVDKVVADNIRWVRHNFVRYKLPFRDNSFDFVRMADLALAIPHERWPFVLSEVYRVLATGGRLEIIDDPVSFPYVTQQRPASHIPSRPKRAPSHWDTDSESDDDSELDSYPGKPRKKANRNSHKDDPHAEWDANKKQASDLESIFLNMLSSKYGVIPRPHLDMVLSNVFGQGSTVDKHSFQLALPGRDYPTDGSGSGRNSLGGGRSSLDKERDFDTLSTGSADSAEQRKSGPHWGITVEWGKGSEKDGWKKHSKKGSRTSDSSLSSLPPLPSSISAKALGRLGITEIPKPSGSYQPDGLILWPQTLLVMTPAEVEDAVCKHVQSLLGCKAALADFVQEQKDEQGNRLIGQKEFDWLLWDYECFRRSRFNLPADRPDLRLDVNDRDSALFKGSRRSTIHLDAPPQPDASLPSDHPQKRGDVTFVRTIHVWEARKY